MNKRVRIIVTSLLLTAFAATMVDACPTCKEGLNNDGGNMIQGYFWSIIFMMSMPFLILGGLSSMFYLDVRRARRLKQQTEAEIVAATGSVA